MDQPIRVLLLDLGGVLVELDLEAAKGTWFNPELSTEENWRRWLESADSQSLERGEITPLHFARLLIDRHSLDTTPEQFVEGFRNWVVGFYPTVFSILDQVTDEVDLAVFSNITEVHWPPLLDTLRANTRIRDYFASYLIGKAKPDVGAYRFVCDQMGVAPGEVLFVDDNPVNIKGALATGLVAELVEGPDQLRSVLEGFDLIPATRF